MGGESVAQVTQGAPALLRYRTVTTCEIDAGHQR
ncbi:MAG: hypothetical protein QOE11_1160 [Solirubrobacteraceae bacterium]|jgi:hypothetical protein|nr:hypothetical protein [Solirubrobacteraceae bacterium]